MMRMRNPKVRAPCLVVPMQAVLLIQTRKHSTRRQLVEMLMDEMAMSRASAYRYVGYALHALGRDA